MFQHMVFKTLQRKLHDKLLTEELDQTIKTFNPNNVKNIDSINICYTPRTVNSYKDLKNSLYKTDGL